MMEPHASVASWDGDAVTVWTANQMIDWATDGLAQTLGMPKEKVRVISPFIGGGFGGKLFLRSDAILAALGARGAQAREGRADPAVDVQQHDAPARHDPAHPHRGGPRRPDDRHRP
jgi:CO/xanthine dehydrogenase Mo-binding subunit